MAYYFRLFILLTLTVLSYTSRAEEVSFQDLPNIPEWTELQTKGAIQNLIHETLKNSEFSDLRVKEEDIFYHWRPSDDYYSFTTTDKDGNPFSGWLRVRFMEKTISNKRTGEKKVVQRWVELRNEIVKIWHRYVYRICFELNNKSEEVIFSSDGTKLDSSDWRLPRG